MNYPIFEKVQDILCDTFGIKREKVTLGAELSQTLDLDSLEIIEFVVALETEYSISILADTFSADTTIEQVVDYLEQRIAAHKN